MKNFELPFVKFGNVEGKGLLISLPFRPLSMNTYARMHWSKKKDLKENYRSIMSGSLFEKVITSYLLIEIKDGYGKIDFRDPLFVGLAAPTWYLSFLNNRPRDYENYSQKLMMDAIVSLNIIQDDNSKYLSAPEIKFLDKIEDRITLFLRGEMRDAAFNKKYSEVSREDFTKLTGESL